MSNYLAVATVTAALQRTLQASVQADIDSVRVTTVAPSQIGSGTPETGINLFLYQAVRNQALQHPDAVSLRARNKTTSKRQTALELHYMLSFYGSDTELEPHRLLGSVVRTFSDRTVLTNAMIRDTITDSTFTFLSDSDLADQIQQMTIAPIDMSLEDLSKVWSVFFQTPYVLSLAYKVTVVMIDGEDPVQRALPVRDRRFGGIAALPGRPWIDHVVAQEGRLSPILADSTLIIRGRQLQGTMTHVRIGGVETVPQALSDTEITLSLSGLPATALRAGVQSLQVIHQATQPTLATANSNQANSQSARESITRHSAESNVAPFVLRPSLVSVTVSEIEGRGEEHRSGIINLQTNLPIDPFQRVVLELNERSTHHPTAYMFDVAPRASATSAIAIPIEDIKAGEYLVRVAIDGAESLLEVDHHPDSSTFNGYIGPTVVIV